MDDDLPSMDWNEYDSTTKADRKEALYVLKKWVYGNNHYKQLNRRVFQTLWHGGSNPISESDKGKKDPTFRLDYQGNATSPYDKKQYANYQIQRNGPKQTTYTSVAEVFFPPEEGVNGEIVLKAFRQSLKFHRIVIIARTN